MLPLIQGGKRALGLYGVISPAKERQENNKPMGLIMRLSRYFLPVLKENPAEAQIVSHRLMLRAGMIKQASAGIYSWLPLGFKVLRKLEKRILNTCNVVHGALTLLFLQNAVPLVREIV